MFDLSYTIRVVNEATEPLRRITSDFDRFDNTIARKTTSSLDRVNSKLKRLQGTMNRHHIGMFSQGGFIGGMVSQLGGAVGLGALIRTNYSYQKSLNMLQATLNASKGQMAGLNKLAIHLGKTTQFHASDAANAMVSMAQSGYKVNTIMAAMPQILNLAAAGQLNMADSAYIVDGAIATFQMHTKDLGSVADTISKMAASSKINVQEMGAAFNYSALAAKSAGLNFKQTVALLATIAKAGMPATMVGTSSTQLFSHLLNLNKAGRYAFKDLGLNANKYFNPVTKQITNMPGLITDFIAKLNAAQKAKVFGTRGARAAEALATMALKKNTDYQHFYNLALHSQGTAARMAKQQMGGLVGAWKLLTSAMEAAFLGIGQSGFNNILVKLMHVVTKLINLFAALPAPVKNLTLAIVGIVAIGAPAIYLLRFFATGLKLLILPLKAVKIAVEALKWAQIALDAAWEANPIGVIITALAALGFGIYEAVKHFKTLKRIVLDVWHVVIDVMDKIGGLIDNFIAELAKLAHIPFIGKWLTGGDSNHKITAKQISEANISYKKAALQNVISGHIFVHADKGYNISTTPTLGGARDYSLSIGAK